MIGIYKYTNQITKQIYIGQSVDIKHRYYTHKSSAYNPNVHEYTSNLSKAIRQYGLDNFDFEVIQEVSQKEYEQNKNILNQLEKKYIQKYDSYHNGYNMTEGGNTFPQISTTRKGEKNGRARMTKEQVSQIRELWATPIPFRQAWKLWKYDCPSERCFKKIWTWETWPDVKIELKTSELLEWHKTKGKSLSHDEVHNTILSTQDIEQIKKDKDLYTGPTDCYKKNKIAQKMSLSGFRKTWNKYIK